MQPNFHSRQIISSNKDFVVVIKKPGQLSTPSRLGTNDPRVVLGTALQTYCDQQIYPVHRLDFEVGGIMLYALNKIAHRESQKWFENKTIIKTYRALTLKQDFSHIYDENQKVQENIFLHKEMLWNSEMVKGKKRSYIKAGGDKAITQAKWIEVNENILSWDLSPITGRSHQLRLELARRGFPILADSLYGSKFLTDRQSHWKLEYFDFFYSDCIFLWAYKLDLSQIDESNRFGLNAKIAIDIPFK